MGLASPDSKGPSDVASSLNSMKKKSAVVGSHMSVEELRMNKAILKEISKKKKNGMDS
jgi:precorrin-6B methylase 1